MGRKPDPVVDNRVREILIEDLDHVRSIGPGKSLDRLVDLLGLHDVDPDLHTDMAEDIDHALEESGPEAMVNTALKKMSPEAYNRLRHRAAAQLSRERRKHGHPNNSGATIVGLGPGRALVDLDLDAIAALDRAAHHADCDRSEAIRRLAAQHR